MTCKLKEKMDKGGHYDVEHERVDGKVWHYDVQIEMGGLIRTGQCFFFFFFFFFFFLRVDGKGGIMLCKLKGRMDKGGHYDVEKKGWMEKGEI